jgi:hypothetical protein
MTRQQSLTDDGIKRHPQILTSSPPQHLHTACRPVSRKHAINDTDPIPPVRPQAGNGSLTATRHDHSIHPSIHPSNPMKSPEHPRDHTTHPPARYQRKAGEASLQTPPMMVTIMSDHVSNTKVEPTCIRPGKRWGDVRESPRK